MWVKSHPANLNLCDILRNMKTCSKCGEEKPLSEFGWKVKAKGTLSSWCKVCQREYAKAHYDSKTQYYLDKAKRNNPKYRSRNVDFVIDYLKNHPCVDCGESDIEVLEFDHIEMIGTSGNRIGVYMSGSIEALEREIAKCQVRCGNCHIRRTRQQMGWSRMGV